MNTHNLKLNSLSSNSFRQNADHKNEKRQVKRFLNLITTGKKIFNLEKWLGKQSLAG